MFFDALIPDTTGYMIAGYAVFFIVSAIYLVSFFVRARNLNRDLSTLETIQEEKPAPKVEPKAKPKAPAPIKRKAKPAPRKSTKANKPQKKTARRK